MIDVVPYIPYIIAGLIIVIAYKLIKRIVSLAATVAVVVVVLIVVNVYVMPGIIDKPLDAVRERTNSISPILKNNTGK